MKKCSRCKEELPLESFANNKSRKDGKQSYCNPCRKAWYEDYYSNGETEKQRLRAQRLKRVADIQALIRQRKDVPCVDCGVRYPHYVMDFDHVRGKKLFNVGRPQGRSFAVVKAEIGKCEVVCSNCHRQRTHNRLQATLGS